MGDALRYLWADRDDKCARRCKSFALLCASSVVLTAYVGDFNEASAETLRGALAAAYKFNPDIEAERANLRATDESVPEAKSGYRPNVSANADIGSTLTTTRPPNLTTGNNPGGAELNINQNLFNGFRTRNSVNVAEANVRAGRANLQTTEQSILLQSVTAYMNVVRDQDIVRFREKNVRVLTANLKASQDRFAAGEVTRTDVAQSRARRAGSVSLLDLARATLKQSRANYVRLIGHAPNRLRRAGVPEKLLPRTLKSATHRATNEAPSVVSALYLEQAARHNVDVIWGELLPSVDVAARFQKRYNVSEAVDRTSSSSVIGTLSVPLYSSGSVRARVRQAKHLHVQRIQLVATARVVAREAAVSAWATLTAARAQLRSDRAQESANKIALAGVREEEKVGQRTLLDVLDAEQELVDSQISLVSTQRDLVVGAYSLISATGRLTAKELHLSKKIYDPEEHYFDVRKAWFGISITHQNGKKERVDLWESHGKRRSFK